MRYMDEFELQGRVERLVVSCSDRRLSEHLDSTYNDGKTVFVRTAGADVLNAEATIVELVERLGIKEITLLPHTDTSDISKGCGWAGRLAVEGAEALKGKGSGERYIGAAQVERFTRAGLVSRGKIEAGNLGVQTALLRDILPRRFRDIAINGETLDTAAIPNNDELGHILVLTGPSAARYSDMAAALNKSGGARVGQYNAYYSQMNNIDGALVDARLFTGALHISDVRVLSLSPGDNELMRAWTERLRSEEFMKGLDVSLVAAGRNSNPRRLRA